MIVKAKVDFTIYIGNYIKKIFVAGNEYYAYKSDEIADCYIVLDEFNVLYTISEHRLKTDFDIITDEVEDL